MIVNIALEALYIYTNKVGVIRYNGVIDSRNGVTDALSTMLRLLGEESEAAS